jgi:hypothetical protein
MGKKRNESFLAILIKLHAHEECIHSKVATFDVEH